MGEHLRPTTIPCICLISLAPNPPQTFLLASSHKVEACSSPLSPTLNLSSIPHLDVTIALSGASIPHAARSLPRILAHHHGSNHHISEGGCDEHAGPPVREECPWHLGESVVAPQVGFAGSVLENQLEKLVNVLLGDPSILAIGFLAEGGPNHARTATKRDGRGRGTVAQPTPGRQRIRLDGLRRGATLEGVEEDGDLELVP